MRYLTVLFLVITFLWWVLLLVSTFISPPGLHTRGSGFFDFAYTTLTLGILLNSLLFFTGPSLAMRVSQGILALFLLIDLIIIVGVRRLRGEEGPAGITSVAWATLVAAWCVFTDRIVAWAKREEEERLTGRPETRRTLIQWLSVFASTTILIGFCLITLLMTATLTLRSLDAGLEMDGKRIRISEGKYDVHFACVGNITFDANGNKSPTILLEAGEDPVEYDFEHWAYAAMRNGAIDRYCYWDRPGYAWSDNAPSPHSAGMSADALAEALAIEGEEGPWILVSAGYGSIVSRIFSARNFREVVGIMMVDPLHEDLLGGLASPTRGFIIWGWGVISPLGIRRVIGAIFNGQTRQDRVYGKSAYQGGKFIKAQLQENLVASSFSKQEISTARTIQDHDTPLVVVSSGIHVRTNREWEKKQSDLTHITGNLLSWDVVNKAPHYVWHTQDGRDLMEKRLGELVKEHSKSREKQPDKSPGKTPDKGGDKKPDDGGDKNPDDGGDGGKKKPDDGGKKKPDNGDKKKPDNGDKKKPDDGDKKKPDDGDKKKHDKSDKKSSSIDYSQDL
jgi:pimeloyl-ACP methyl ester carboxylesterase